MVMEPPDPERTVTPRTQPIAPHGEKLAPHGPAIKISTEARAYATTHGGTIYLRVRQSHCCSGALTYLDASTTARSDGGNYVTFDSELLKVQLLDIGVGLPDEVSVELRGKIRPRLMAYWNGCAYRL
jgi:hypothetical protein